MFFDADDFVSKNIVNQALNQPGSPGWSMRRGYFIQGDKITYRNKFDEMCGTSHILNYDLLTTDIPFDELTVESSQEDIEQHVHPFFVRGVLGCHMNYEPYFFNMHSSLSEWKDPGSVAYNMGTGENHSGKKSTCGDGWFPLRKTNSGKLEQALINLNLPIPDHSSKRIGVLIPDRNCRQALVEEGLYHPVELSISEYVSVYGEDICREYETVTFVRNPWDRLVTLYHEHRNKLKYGSFIEFLEDGDTQSQMSYLRLKDRTLVDTIIKSEERANEKIYWGHYSDYYDQYALELVEEKFGDDIAELDYLFEELSCEDLDQVPTPVKYEHDRIPNILHFSYGMAPYSEQFSFVQYLAIKSAIHYNNPETVYFHYHTEPYGHWWDMIKPYLSLSQVDLVREVYGNPVTHYAHMSDVVRMRMLYTY